MPEAGSPAQSVLEALGLVLFSREDSGTLRLIGQAPGWLAALWPALAKSDGALPVADASPFLENFLIDAEECWRKGGAERAKSGPWIEQDGSGAEVELEATAMTANGQSILLLERLGEAFEAKKSVLQRARETVIAHQRLNSEIQKKEILLHCVADEMTAALANIITSLRLIELEDNGPRTKLLLGLATRATQEQQTLIHRILGVFEEELRGVHGHSDPTTAGADWNVVLHRALDSAKPLFAEKGVRLDAPEAGDSAAQIPVDAAHLERVVANLLENALERTPAGGTVVVRAEDEPEALILRVEDKGAAIAPEVYENLFAQWDPSNAGTPASALRLALLPHRGGELRRRNWLQYPPRGRPALLDSPNEKQRRCMKTLVLIDSDALSRALLSQCLTGQGWRVLEAEDGEAGLDLVVKHHPTAVICDLRTPKGNGFKVCRLIREHAQLGSTRVVLMGVSRFSNDRDTAFATGADDYLVKPIGPGDLLASLEQCRDQEIPENKPKPVVTGPTLVRFWGVRGSIPTPGIQTAMFGGNTSCVEVRVGDQVIILDAGSGIRALGQSLMREFRDKPLNITMLVTHTHWDHIQGFPFFIPAYNPKVGVRIVGYEGAVHGLRGALLSKCRARFFPSGSIRWRAMSPLKN